MTSNNTYVQKSMSRPWIFQKNAPRIVLLSRLYGDRRIQHAQIEQEI